MCTKFLFVDFFNVTHYLSIIVSFMLFVVLFRRKINKVSCRILFMTTILFVVCKHHPTFQQPKLAYRLGVSRADLDFAKERFSLPATVAATVTGLSECFVFSLGISKISSRVEHSKP
jgi:hypothetical protein